jgi:hypothetical protein
MISVSVLILSSLFINISEVDYTLAAVETVDNSGPASEAVEWAER